MAYSVAAICDTKKTVSGLVSASLKYGVNNIFSDKVKKSSVLGKTTNLGNKIATFAVTDTIITGTFPTQNIVQKVTIKKLQKLLHLVSHQEHLACLIYTLAATTSQLNLRLIQ